MTPIAASTPVSSTWRSAWLGLFVVIATTLTLYRDTALSMVSLWSRSETFTHCFLVPPIVVWLIWRRWPFLRPMEPRPSMVALAAIPLVGLGWLLADLAAVNALAQLGLVSMLVLSVPALLGIDVARVILFPLLFSFFAVPVGEFLMPQFMDWTADFTVWALRFTGIPVYREGLQFVIPSGNWSVVEACSGIRYLIASMTVGALYAYLSYRSAARRVIFVLLSVIVPIVANWLRAYMIVMLGHLSGNRLAVGVDHLIYGWAFFGVVILAMFFLGARWAEAEATPTPAHASVASGGPAAAAPWRAWGACAVALVLLALAPLAREWSEQRQSASNPAWALPLEGQSGWTLVRDASPNFVPAFDNPVLQSHTRYERSGRAVGLYVAYYRNQSYRSKLVSSTNVLVRSQDTDWAVAQTGAGRLVLDGAAVPVRSTLLRRLPINTSDPSAGLRVLQVYWVSGRLTTSDHLAKAYSAVSRLLGQGDDAAVILIYSAQDKDLDAAAALQDFASAHLPTLTRSLRDVHAKSP